MDNRSADQKMERSCLGTKIIKALGWLPVELTMSELNDHDLLIELRTEMKAVRADIKEIKDNHTSIISDHETRIRFIERYLWAAWGVLAVIQFIGFAYFFDKLR